MGDTAGTGLARLLAGLDDGRRRQALTHASWSRGRARSYERLEFLGDSALEVIVSEELMRRHPDADEGDLSWMRQAVVNREACADAATASGLDRAMVAAAPGSERQAAGALARRLNVRAALAEAVIGAAWLDLGAEPTRAAVLDSFAAALEAAVPGVRDPKTTLQEEAARRGLEVAYRLLASEGPPQDRTF
ncbi:MAG: ribonuclease III domain-containing protein, partial [Miltoncostaeaceae bacterium]